MIATGCANYQPIVDTQGVDMGRYNDDLTACQGYAAQVDPASHAAAGPAQLRVELVEEVHVPVGDISR